MLTKSPLLHSVFIFVSLYTDYYTKSTELSMQVAMLTFEFWNLMTTKAKKKNTTSEDQRREDLQNMSIYVYCIQFWTRWLPRVAKTLSWPTACYWRYCCSMYFLDISSSQLQSSIQSNISKRNTESSSDSTLKLSKVMSISLPTERNATI